MRMNFKTRNLQHTKKIDWSWIRSKPSQNFHPAFPRYLRTWWTSRTICWQTSPREAGALWSQRWARYHTRPGRSESVGPADWRLGRRRLGRRLGRDQGHAGEPQTKETCDGWHRRPAGMAGEHGLIPGKAWAEYALRELQGRTSRRSGKEDASTHLFSSIFF